MPNLTPHRAAHRMILVIAVYLAALALLMAFLGCSRTAPASPCPGPLWQRGPADSAGCG